jgi:anti-sigma factor (TIGR02949 family)
MMMPDRGRLSCDETLRRLDDYLDRALGPAELTMVAAHLADCVPCAAAARFEATVIDAIRERLRRLAAPPGLLDGVRARLEAELHGG